MNLTTRSYIWADPEPYLWGLEINMSDKKFTIEKKNDSTTTQLDHVGPKFKILLTINVIFL